jgi:hypothetical protein
VCDKCGQPYLNFCVRCAKQFREEAVENLMEQYGMSLEHLIRTLSTFLVNCPEPNLAALKLAVDLRSMKPPVRTDVTSGGQPIVFDDDAKTRLLTKLTQITRSEDAE